MSIDLLLVLCVSASVIGFAVWCGGKPEKIGAAILLLDLCVDLVIRESLGHPDFLGFSNRRLVIDMVEFAMLLTLALRANRLWPIFSAASQLVAVAGSLAVLGSGRGMSVAYWAVTQLPFFGQLMALALGTIFHVRRRASLGPYREWRVSPRAEPTLTR